MGEPAAEDVSQWLELTCPTCNKPSVFSGADGGQVERTVTLVHGTWAKHASWMQVEAVDQDQESEESTGLKSPVTRLVCAVGRLNERVFELFGGDETPLGRLYSFVGGKRAAVREGPSLAGQLAALPDTVLYRFCWTGKNRHHDRIEAANRLKKNLLKLVDVHPHAAHHVIAHSHGGNVALYALQDDRELAPHEQLRQRLGHTGGGVVTLATPFLHVRERSGGLFALWRLWLAVAVLLLSLMATVFGGLLIGERNWQYWAVVGIAAVGVITLLLIAGSAIRYPEKCVGRTTFLPFGGRNGQRKAEFDKLTPACLGPGELLVVRPMGDEAAGALVATQFLLWLLRRLLSFLDRMIGRILAVAIAVTAVTVVSTSIIEHFSTEAERQLQGWFDVVMRLFVGFGVSLAAVASLPALLLTIIAASAVGRDGLFLPFFVDLTVEAGPPGETRVCRVDVATEGGLSHSRIYDDHEVIAAIVDHLTSE